MSSIDPKFAAVTESLHSKFEQLTCGVASRFGELPITMPESGVYLFSEADLHLYVGRSNRLEKLWDAFERINTLEPGIDKKVAADTMLNRVARSGSRFRQALANEAVALTNIGNSHRIRHSETSQEPCGNIRPSRFSIWEAVRFHPLAAQFKRPSRLAFAPRGWVLVPPTVL